MVTSHKMNENEIGYRGSKSLLFLIKNKSVKEQRVDGSYFINKNKNLMKLRCTLMGFERNYQTKISSKQIIIQNKNFSNKCDTSSILPVWTEAKLIRIIPWFVTGFTDAVDCLGLYVYKNKNYKTGSAL